MQENIQPTETKPRPLSDFIKKLVVDVFPGRKRTKEAPLEILQFNREQISQAVEKILDKAKKTKKLGVVATEQLEIKNQTGSLIPCQLRYLAVNDAHELWGFDESLAFRLELFAGNLPDSEDYSFSPSFDDFNEYINQGLRPIAFRQNYLLDLPEINLLVDGLPFSGISYVAPDLNRLGIGKAIFENVNAQPMLEDFVHRTKRFWADFNIPKEVDHASFLISDSTFSMGQSSQKQIGWTERRIKELGLELANPQKYPTVGHNKAYIQKVFFK